MEERGEGRSGAQASESTIWNKFANKEGKEGDLKTTHNEMMKESALSKHKCVNERHPAKKGTRNPGRVKNMASYRKQKGEGRRKTDTSPKKHKKSGRDSK